MKLQALFYKSITIILFYFNLISSSMPRKGEPEYGEKSIPLKSVAFAIDLNGIFFCCSYAGGGHASLESASSFTGARLIDKLRRMHFSG